MATLLLKIITTFFHHQLNIDNITPVVKVAWTGQHTCFHEHGSLFIVSIECPSKHVGLLQTVDQNKQLRRAQVAEHALVRDRQFGAGRQWRERLDKEEKGI